MGGLEDWGLRRKRLCSCLRSYSFKSELGTTNFATLTEFWIGATFMRWSSSLSTSIDSLLSFSESSSIDYFCLSGSVCILNNLLVSELFDLPWVTGFISSNLITVFDLAYNRFWLNYFCLIRSTWGSTAYNLIIYSCIVSGRGGFLACDFLR